MSRRVHLVHEHPKNAKNELERAMGVLDSAGLRRTRPRVALLSALIGEHGPFSVDEVRRLSSARGLDRVTIYRCLTAFEALGLVRRCEFGDNVSRYEYSGGEQHHHHVVCRSCRRTESVAESGCVPPALVGMVQAMGYREVSHTLEFFGICPDCASREGKKPASRKSTQSLKKKPSRTFD